MLIDAVYGRDLKGFALGLGEPNYGDKPRYDLAFFAAAIHLCEERGVAKTSRIDIDCWTFFKRSPRIGNAKLIDDGGMLEQLSKRLMLVAIGNRHHSPVAPAQYFIVVARQAIGIGSDQGVEVAPNVI